MRRRVQAVKGKGMGFLKAAKTFNVPSFTFLKNVKIADSEECLSF
jgi:hypothetical protein